MTMSGTSHAASVLGCSYFVCTLERHIFGWCAQRSQPNSRQIVNNTLRSSFHKIKYQKIAQGDNRFFSQSEQIGCQPEAVSLVVDARECEACERTWSEGRNLNQWSMTRVMENDMLPRVSGLLQQHRLQCFCCTEQSVTMLRTLVRARVSNSTGVGLGVGIGLGLVLSCSSVPLKCKSGEVRSEAGDDSGGSSTTVDTESKPNLESQEDEPTFREDVSTAVRWWKVVSERMARG